MQRLRGEGPSRGALLQRSRSDGRNSMGKALVVICVFVLGWVTSAAATPFSFSTGNPDGRIATASRPDIGTFEIESADDFLATTPIQINSATFTGLLTGATPTVGQVVVEIYRVFPNDSDVGRTSGPPTFSTPQVPTRVNSPSDVEFVDRDTADANLTFTTSVLDATFSTLLSLIHI